MPSDLRTTYLGVDFQNPFILASAPPTATSDMVRRAFEAGWSGAVIKTLTFDPVKKPAKPLCNHPKRQPDYRF